MKHAVFFCENCRKTVPLEATVCPHCGSRFTAVQCPRCAFVGEARLFSTGCPHCGFLGPAAGKQSVGQTTRRTAPPPGPAATPVRKGRRESDDTLHPLPGWFYALAAILLVIVLLALIFILLRMR